MEKTVYMIIHDRRLIVEVVEKEIQGGLFYISRVLMDGNKFVINVSALKTIAIHSVNRFVKRYHRAFDD